jgi:protein-S-isoprenylcysteine O-methyltransferase Ste14
MRIATRQAKSKTNESLLLLVSAAAITFALFFIDEGYYDFRWMKNPGNWIAFVAYVLILFVGQLAVQKLVLSKYRGSGKLAISMVGGTALVLLILFGIYSIIR